MEILKILLTNFPKYDIIKAQKKKDTSKNQKGSETMSNAKKVTKANRFEDIKALLNGDAPAYGTTIEEAIDFINHEQEILANKNSKRTKDGEKKLTPVQEQNEVFKGYILDELAKVGGDYYPAGMTCTEILHAVPALFDEGFGVHKVSALMRQLGEKGSGRVTSQKVKGETRFSLV